MTSKQRNISLIVILLLVALVAGYLYYSPPSQSPTPISSPENAAANLAAAREDFSAADWIKEHVTNGANASAAPDGTTSTDRLAETAEQGRHRILTTITGVRPGHTYTLSLFVTPAGRNGIQMEMGDTKPGKYGAVMFDLTGKQAVQRGDVTHSGVEQEANGWYRCWATMPYATDSVGFNFSLMDAAGSMSYTGDGHSGLLIWGVQFEQGSQPSRYHADHGPG
jgi:hypothetical protein